jgi:arabinofuranosyltransferase
MANDTQPVPGAASRDEPVASETARAARTQQQPSSSASSGPRGAPLAGLLPAAALLLYLIAVIRTAWISDDAFITMRALDNLMQGYGLVSNPPERVLGFTNPLWALLLLVPYGLGTEAYWAAMATALMVSTVVALWVLRRAAPNALSATVAILWMAGSAAYVDFSTSGLENPLAHLLLAIFVTAFVAGQLDATRLWAWLLAALIALNRLDHALLVAPALASLLPSPRALGPGLDPLKQTGPGRHLLGPLARVARAAALGSLPLLAWLGFAVVYYGFPFPNTAYAKLNTSVPVGELVLQGLLYLVDGAKRDPLTLLVIALGLVGLVRDRSRSAIAIGAGVVLYLGYVVRIGGDFMAGRFLTAPFLVCVVWLAARGLPRTPAREVVGLALLSALLLALFPTNFLVDEKLECVFGASGIANERKCYAEFTALSENVRERKYESEGRFERGADLRKHKRRVAVESNVGMTGFAAGPKVHVIDLLALTDPLLARIPYRVHGDFRVGHFHRDAPKGYEKSVRSGVNRLEDPCLHAYYDVLLPVIRGPLFSAQRWKAIWGINFGKYDYLMAQPCRLAKGARAKQ